MFCREGSQKFGGDDTQLIQLTPVYRVVKGRSYNIT